MTVTDLKMSTFAQAEQRLAETLPGYEERAEQTLLAESVETAFAEGKHLLAEAGTGTGKSFATLIPAILSGQRVIVSTATKALQDQLAFKDIPFLQENLGVDFTATILKGRGNYLCINRLEMSDRVTPSMRSDIMEILDAQRDNEDFTGERDALGIEISHGEWYEIRSDADECGDCDEGRCFATRARTRAWHSNVVVVNHALYMTELLVRRESDGYASFLGPHTFAIFDEAHNLEDYAASSLGDQLKLRGVENVAGQAVNVTRQYDSDRERQASDLSFAVTSAAKELWATLKPGRIRFQDLMDNGDQFINLTNALIDLEEFLGEKWPKRAGTGSTREKQRGSRARRNVASMVSTMRHIVTDDFTETLRYVEEEYTPRRNEKITVLKYGPIEVAPYLRQILFGGRDHGHPICVLVSATLATNGKFDYIAGRLGVDEYFSLDVGTPFDYASQALLYVPDDLPHPSKERDAWSSMSINRMRDLINLSEGRALMLFTSIKEMKAAYETISELVDYTCLIQYSESNDKLAEKFREDTHSILFATKSFMEGVDFQGDTLSLVVVNKMPFPVPTEPITEARMEKIEAEGGSEFRDYMIPVMTLTLKQAVGRLIRNKTDKGVYAILDGRLLKGYGKGIVKSLPDAPLATTLDEVEKMYS